MGGEFTLGQLVQLVRDGGAITGLLILLIGGHRRWWVWGYQLAEMRRERDEWKTLFLRSMKVTEVAVSVAQTSSSKEG